MICFLYFSSYIYIHIYIYIYEDSSRSFLIIFWIKHPLLDINALGSMMFKYPGPPKSLPQYILPHHYFKNGDHAGGI